MENDIFYDKGVPGHSPKKFVCPGCGKKRFVRFYSSRLNDYLPEQFGKCDREESCGYVLTPWEWLKTGEAADYKPEFVKKKTEIKPEVKTLYVDKQVCINTLKHYESNTFVVYLKQLLGHDLAIDRVLRYFIGTAKGGGTIFWQTDRNYRVRTGSKIFYKPDGHRDKSKGHVARLFLNKDGYSSCFFGEHLLNDAPDNTVIMLCESEKTAVLCSAFFPYMNSRPTVWLASSGLHGFTDEKLSALDGRTVCLVPDFSYAARATWGIVPMRKGKNDKNVTVPMASGTLDESYMSLKQRMLQRSIKVSVFDPFPDVDNGDDLADYLHLFELPILPEKPDFDRLIIKDRKRAKKKPSDDLQTESEVLPGEGEEDDTDAEIKAKYGRFPSKLVYDLAREKLEAQKKIAADPRVQALVEKFGLEVKFNF